MTKVIDFQTRNIGDNMRFDADRVLDEAKTFGYVTMAIIGEDAEGNIITTGNASNGQLVILLELAKAQLIFGDGEE